MSNYNKGTEGRDDSAPVIWSQKWIKALSGFGWTSKLLRGRPYARAGRVTDFVIRPGVIEARVQGSSPRPYKVKIEMDVIPEEDWNKIIDKLSEKAIFTAKLLAGEMPENISEVFDDAGVPLFTEKKENIRTSCYCAEGIDVCRHVAAVFYLAGKEFDGDPFLLFSLRGLPQEELIKKIRNARGIENEAASSDLKNTVSMKDLMLDMRKYKELDPDILNMGFSYEMPQIPHTLAKRLGAPQFFRDEEVFLKLMGLYYDKTTDMLRDELFRE